MAAMVLPRLLAAAPPPDRDRRPDPVATLVGTILSQHTTDATSERAFAALVARFPTWDEVVAAPVDAVADAIRVCGLADQKAARVHRALAAIPARTGGAWSLEFLRDLPVDEARAWLTAIDGVGIKTASIVLLFALDMPAFPVDTHIHRVAGRLRIIPAGASAERAHHLLEALIPPADYYAVHMALIHHGRTICRARQPRCPVCVVAEACPWRAAQLGT
jgi:endonuclease-3